MLDKRGENTLISYLDSFIRASKVEFYISFVVGLSLENRGGVPSLDDGRGAGTPLECTVILAR